MKCQKTNQFVPYQRLATTRPRASENKSNPLGFKMLFVFLGLISQVIGKGWWEGSKAIDITADNRKEYIGGKKHVLLEYFTPPCHWCQVLFPDLEKLIEHYTDENSIGYRDDFIIARVNGQAYHDFVVE